MFPKCVCNKPDDVRTYNTTLQEHNVYLIVYYTRYSQVIMKN